MPKCICIKAQANTQKLNTHKDSRRLHVPVVCTVLVNNSGIEESSGLLLRQQVTLQPAARTWWLPLLSSLLFLSSRFQKFVF